MTHEGREGIDRSPLYLQVAGKIRSKIMSGELGAGEQLPTMRQLEEAYGISQPTALRVMGTLRAEGLVTTTPGVGTHVATRETFTRGARDRFTQMATTGKIYPPGEYAIITSTGMTDAPSYVIEALGLEEGGQALHRHRITYNGAGPVSASTSWFPAEMADIVPAILSKHRINGGTPLAIKEATGRVPHSGEEQLSAGAANTSQAEDLGVEVGSPVHIGRTILRDTQGDVMEVGTWVAPPYKWERFEYELPVPE